jgi:hypothetical protein
MVVVDRRGWLVVGRSYIDDYIAMHCSTTHRNSYTGTQQLGQGKDRKYAQRAAKTGVQQFFQGKSPNAKKSAFSDFNVGKPNRVDEDFVAIW